MRSSRTDGDYRLAGSAEGAVSRLSFDEKAKLTTWIVDQHRNGIEVPVVTTAVINEIQQRRRLPVSERKRRFFLLAIQMRFQPGDSFQTRGRIVVVASDHYERDCARISAWTECATDDERESILNLLDENMIKRETPSSPFMTFTSRGFEMLEAQESGGAPSNQAFIAMWFDTSMDEAANAIESAVTEAGYKPMRVGVPSSRYTTLPPPITGKHDLN